MVSVGQPIESLRTIKSRQNLMYSGVLRVCTVVEVREDLILLYAGMYSVLLL